jgi:hypothetical protein
MKQELLWMFGLVLLLTSCRSDALPIVRPTPTALPLASVTATQTAQAAATEHARTVMEAAAAKVDDWVMNFLPHSGPYAGMSVEFDQENSRIVIVANPEALAELINDDLQIGEPISREYWPLSLLDALADQDPSVAVELIPGIVLITDTLQITDPIGQ